MTRRRLPRLDMLTPQRRMFVAEYLIDFNAAAAAVRSGYAPQNAGVIGASLMKLPPVKDAIDRAIAERSKRVGVNADRILQDLGRIINGDPRAVLNEDGSLKAPSELNDDDARMVAGVKTRRIVEIGDDGKMRNAEIQEVRLVSKLDAMRLAMQHLGMLKEHVVHEIGESLAKQMEAAQRRTGVQEIVDPNALTAEEQAMLAKEEVLEGEFEEVESGVAALPDPAWSNLL